MTRSPGHRRGKRLVAVATDGGKVVVVGHVRWWKAWWRFGCGGWRGFAPWGIAHNKFRGVVGFALDVAAFARGVHVVADQIFFFLLVTDVVKLEN